MFSYWQAILIGALQGITELFPISSLGHSVILEGLLNWQMKQSNPMFLTFLVATHMATALVLLVFFWKDWWRVAQGLWRSLKNREVASDDVDAKLGWLLIVATIPAGVLGLLFEDYFKKVFSSPLLVSGLLIANGVMLLAAEKLRQRSIAKAQRGESERRISHLSWIQAIQVGALQCLALLPGFSRTGSTITGSLLVGLSHEDAARFSFLLATPIIFAASVLKIPELITPAGQAVLGPTIVGALASGISAYFAVRFLEKYFKAEKLTPFGIYCILAGVVALAIFLLR